MNNPNTDAILGLGKNIPNQLLGDNSLSNQQYTSVLGLQVPGNVALTSPRDHFLQQMQSWHAALPLRTQWVVLIQNYPQLLTTEVLHQLERNEGNYNNFNISTAVQTLKNNSFNNIIGCIFAQGVNIPSLQNLKTERRNLFGDKQRGFLPNHISSGRDEFNDLTIEFRETNTSFTDFIVRPWSMLASHFGFVARPAGDIRNVGTTVTILQYTRTLKDVSQIPRKVWTFYNCMPLTVDSKNLTYDQEQMEMHDTTWTFSNYTIQNSLYLPLPDIITKVAANSFLKIPNNNRIIYTDDD